MLSVVRSYYQSIKAGAQIAVATATIATAEGAESSHLRPLSNSIEPELSELRLPPTPLPKGQPEFFINAYDSISPNTTFFEPGSHNQTPTAQAFFRSLSLSIKDVEGLLALTTKEIQTTSAVAQKFRLRHPEVTGNLNSFNTDYWNKQLDVIQTNLSMGTIQENSQIIRGLRQRIVDFRVALERYDATATQLVAIEEQINKLDPQLKSLNLPTLEPTRIVLATTAQEWSTGNAAYEPLLRNVESDTYAAERSLSDEIARRESIRRNLTIGALLFGFAGTIAAGSTFLGASAVVDSIRMIPRLLTSWKVGISDRIAFAKLLFNLKGLSSEISDEPKKGRRMGALLSSAAEVIREQTKRGTFAAFYRSLEKEHPRTVQEVTSLAADLILQPSVREILWAKDAHKAAPAKELFTSFAYPDGPPCQMLNRNGTISEEAQRYFEETSKVMRRGLQFHGGFSSLTMEARALPDNTPPLLSRFGYDIADPHESEITNGRLNAPDRDKFPGPGIVISRPSAERMFGLTSSPDEEDPIRKSYEKVWPWAKDALTDVEKTQFIFGRGVFSAQFLEDNAAYRVGKWQMAYLAFNDHFPGNRFQGAYLVPRNAVANIFAQCVIPFGDYTGYTSTFKVPTPKSPTEFLRYCESFGPVIHLTAFSNLSGGLCNGFPNDSLPYHRWERSVREDKSRRLFHDVWGHIHKSFILPGRYSPDWNEEVEAAFKPLEQAHSEIFRVASAYQNSLDVLRLAYTNWKKGFIPRRYVSDFAGSADERWSTDPLDDGVASQNPGRFLMLDEIFHWNVPGKSGKLPKEQLPILSIGPTFNYLAAPDTKLILDSRDLSFKFKGRTVLKPLDTGGLRGRRADLERVWEEYGINSLAADEDLRLYHRESFK